MSKPYGMSQTLEVIRPSGAEDAIWDAVETAISNGWTPEQFKSEAAHAWEDTMKREGKAAAKILCAK